jgi:hypothetical protein
MDDQERIIIGLAEELGKFSKELEIKGYQMSDIIQGLIGAGFCFALEVLGNNAEQAEKSCKLIIENNAELFK